MGLLSILVGSYTVAAIFKKKWLEVFPPFIFCAMLLTYLLGIADWLDKIWLIKWGIVILCILIWGIYWRRSELEEWKIKRRLSTGAVCFACVSAVMALLLRTHVVLEWDDLSHWATTIKQIFYIGAIPKGANALSIYNDYPPISALFSYWFLSDYKEFHEQLLFPIYYFGVMVCLAPFYEKIPDGKTNICKRVFAIIICLLLPGAFASTAMVNLKVDSFVTVLFVYIVISLFDMVLKGERTDFIDIWNIFCALCIMVLSKSVGIYLALTATIALWMFVRKKRVYAIYVLGTGAEMLFYFSWKIFCRFHGNSSYISEGFRNIQFTDYLRTVKAVLVQMPWFLYPVLFYVIGMFLLAMLINKIKISQKGRMILVAFTVGINLMISLFCRYGLLTEWFAGLYDDGSKEYVTKHYIYYFCRQSVTFQLEENVTYGMSALECILLIGVILLLAGSLVDGKKYKTFLFAQYFIMIGFAIYVIGQLAMYRHMFVGPEASVLSAYSRYIMMYLGGWIGGTIFLAVKLWTDLPRGKQLVIYYGLLASVFFLSNIPFTCMCIFQYHENYFAQRWEYRSKAVSVLDKVRQETDRIETGIWISSRGDSGWMKNECLYHSAPNKGFKDYWILDQITEEDLQIKLEESAYGLEFIAVDMECDYSEENRKKLDNILTYFQLEEKKDAQVCVYKLN